MKLSKFIKLDEDAQDERLKKAQKRIFALPGFAWDDNVYILMECDEDDDQIFFKFMSEFGLHDDANGKAMHAYLNSKKIWFDSTAQRNVIMKLSDFLAEF
jgi:hypothetical protein